MSGRSDMAREAPARSVIATLILSGVAPGAGHVHVGRPARGAVLVLAWLLLQAHWARQVAVSWTAARLWAVPAMLTLLVIVVDSARLARRPSPRLEPAWLRRAVLALALLAGGVAVPLLLARDLERHVRVVTSADSGLEPRVEAMDRVIVRPAAGALERGSVVAIESPLGPVLRRVAGLPGEVIELRSGFVVVNGQPWLHDPARILGQGRPAIEPVSVATGQFAILPDQRMPGAQPSPLVEATALLGEVRYVLLPADRDPLRVGLTP